MPEVEGASTGAIGLAPYADLSEHTGPPEIITVPDSYRPFFSTDARSVLVTLYAQHYNFIPNPAFRVDTTGWEINGITPASDAYSWTFANGVDTTNTGRLNSIIAGATSAVDPDPATADPYVNGQLVYVSGVDVWLVIDDTATLTVAQAADVGLALSGDVVGYRVWDPGTALVPGDSWVGQSLQCYGSGMLRYRDGTDRFVHVGPTQESFETGHYQPKRSGPEWTFSVYAKGSGRVRLKMDAYYPEDRQDFASGPEYQNLTSVADPSTEPSGDPAILGPDGLVWRLIEPAPSEAPYYEELERPPAFESVVGKWEDIGTETDDWQRVVVTTRANIPEGAGRASFLAAWWIDAQIEVENADNLLLSAVMLDPTEYPECQYFDGSMTEDPINDDFFWQGEPNNSVSLYYFDRMLRAKWLCERMSYVVPVGRPYQIFFDDYSNPYVCSQESSQS